MTNKDQPTIRRGIPGRVFVIPFVVVLAFLLWLVFSMAVRFQTIMGQLETTRTAWPPASSLYTARYDALDSEVSKQTGEWKSRFTDLRKKFSETTQFDQQSQVIRQLEQLIAEHKKEIPDTSEFNFEVPAIAKIRELERKRESLQSDFVGKCTVGGLRLKLPPVFELQN